MQLIHHTFGPHVTPRFTFLALSLLLRPWAWRKGASQAALKRDLKSLLRGEPFLFASGREALFAYLMSCDFEPGSEILIQGFTCVALPNAIVAAGYVPIYADIDPETLNMNPADVEAKITIRTRAIICQHTFGIPADTSRLRALSDAYGLELIEDCAHIIPDHQGPPIGIHADAIMLSFGRDKAASGIAGGAIILRSKKFMETMAEQEAKARPLPRTVIVRLLLYPLLYSLARPLYGFLALGKVFLLSLREARLLIPILTREEKRGKANRRIHAFPNACAELARQELQNLQSMNDHRRAPTRFYLQGTADFSVPKGVFPDLPLQKFPLLVPEAERTRLLLKKKNIYLEDGWSGAVVCPRDVDRGTTGYVRGRCPHAEEVAMTILCLPTHPTMTEKKAGELMKRLREIDHP